MSDKIKLEVANFTVEKGRKTETVAYLKIVEGRIPGTKPGKDGKKGITPGQILAILLQDEETRKHMISVANQAIAQADQANGNTKSDPMPSVPGVPQPEPLEYAFVENGGWKKVGKTEAAKYAADNPEAFMIHHDGSAWSQPAAAKTFFPVKSVKGEVVVGPLAQQIEKARSK